MSDELESYMGGSYFKPRTALVLLTVLSVVSVCSGLAWGSKMLSLSQIWLYFSDYSGSYTDLVIDGRLPRTAAAWFCGAALGLSGTLMQGLTRNPLGDSGLLGVNTGAAAGIVSVVFFPALEQVSPFWLAVPGALLAGITVCFLGWSAHAGSHARLILAGAAVSACLGAFVQGVSQYDIRSFEYLRFWASGSFGGVSLQQISGFLPFFTPAAAAAILMGRFVNIIALDKHTAQSLGANILLIQSCVLLAAGILAAASVALAGPVAFIGLGAAHLSRKIIGSDYRFLLPASMLAGGCLLSASDVLARVVLAPSEIATGIITALLGAPLLYFMVLENAKGRYP